MLLFKTALEGVIRRAESKRKARFSRLFAVNIGLIARNFGCETGTYTGLQAEGKLIGLDMNVAILYFVEKKTSKITTYAYLPL